jgi:4-diphosphocytidyl-2-C-methyl-D-erythritol kinase
MQAAELLQSRAATGLGARIKLVKRIPAGAGLGGGSSNAATTLMLLKRLWRLSIQRDELAALGATIGSDVPLFLSHAPLNIMRGRGERLEPVASRLEAEVLLALPPIHSPTAAVYAAFARTRRICERPDAATLLRESIDFQKSPQRIDPTQLMSRVFNDLEPAAANVTPALAGFAERLRRESALPFCMSGSGAAYFCLFQAGSNDADAQRARLVARFPEVRFICTAIASRGA